MLVGDCSAPHCDPNQLNWTVLNFVALLIHIPGACDCCDDDDEKNKEEEEEQDDICVACCVCLPSCRPERVA